MGTRLGLQQLLKDLLGTGNVYYQPPETVKLVYPCIVYAKNAEGVIYADNSPYKNHQGYKVTVIDTDPDSLIPAKISRLPLSKFSVHYTKDNLNHDVYNIYY